MFCFVVRMGVDEMKNNCDDRFISWDRMIEGLQSRCEEPRYRLSDEKVRQIVDEVQNLYFTVHNNSVGVGYRSTVLFDEKDADSAGFHATVTRLESVYELITYSL
jgi:hypothetical protein